MRGQSGTLFTGHCVIDEASGRRASGVAGTTVRFGVTTDAELDAYLATGEAMGVAGGFTLDGRSAPFIDGVDGDPGNVIGLSLPLFRSLLASIDIAITDLWARDRSVSDGDACPQTGPDRGRPAGGAGPDGRRDQHRLPTPVPDASAPASPSAR